MKQSLLLLSVILLSCNANAQDIHPLEPINAHYVQLQKLDVQPTAERAQLDAITFPTIGRTPGKQYVGIEPSYLTQVQVDQLKASVQFPANSSVQTRAELDYLLKMQAERTPAAEARVLKLAGVGYWPPLEKETDDLGSNVEDLIFEYNEVTGNKESIMDYPNTLKLLSGVTRDMRIMEFTVKYHLLRARPYLLEPKLEQMQTMGSPSFASGHTLWAYIHAFVWSEILPDKREEFLEIAFEIGHSREVMGIHYPSDEEAARVLAHNMLVNMNKNKQFKKDLAAAKKEWQ